MNNRVKPATDPAMLAFTLDKLRAERGINIEELSRLADLNPKTTIRALDRGYEGSTGLDTLLRLLTGLGIHALSEKFGGILDLAGHAKDDLSPLKDSARFSRHQKDEAIDATIQELRMKASIMLILARDLVGLSGLEIMCSEIEFFAGNILRATEDLEEVYQRTRGKRRPLATATCRAGSR